MYRILHIPTSSYVLHWSVSFVQNKKEFKVAEFSELRAAEKAIKGLVKALSAYYITEEQKERLINMNKYENSLDCLKYGPQYRIEEFEVIRFYV